MVPITTYRQCRTTRKKSEKREKKTLTKIGDAITPAQMTLTQFANKKKSCTETRQRNIGRNRKKDDQRGKGCPHQMVKEIPPRKKP